MWLSIQTTFTTLVGCRFHVTVQCTIQLNPTVLNFAIHVTMHVWIIGLCMFVSSRQNRIYYCFFYILSCLMVVEENYSESVTIVRRQRFEGGFHIRKKYSKK